MAEKISLVKKLAKFWHDCNFNNVRDAFTDIGPVEWCLTVVLNVDPDAIILRLRLEIEDLVNNREAGLAEAMRIAEMRSLINEVELYKSEKGVSKENGKK